MTLLIAYLLMAHAGAHWLWYPLVFVLWVLHVSTVSSPSASSIAQQIWKARK